MANKSTLSTRVLKKVEIDLIKMHKQEFNKSAKWNWGER